MALREQIYESCAQLLAHGIRLRREPARPDLEAIDAKHRAALEEAEAVLKAHPELTQGAPAGRPEIPPTMFDTIEGHHEAKALLLRSLRADRPVHVLLLGPPGTGKTQLLQRIAALPNSRYATGPTISTSGLFTYLLNHPACKRLVIDELDKAEKTDRYMLLTLMESGKITRLQHGAIEEETRIVWVYAAANSDRGLEEPLKRRFAKLYFPAYTREQAAAISERVLKREGIPPARAREIARAVAARSNDPRIAVQVARLTPPGAPLEPVIEQLTVSNP